MLFDANHAPQHPYPDEQAPAEHERELNAPALDVAAAVHGGRSHSAAWLKPTFADGFYDLLSVRSVTDDTFETPSPGLSTSADQPWRLRSGLLTDGKRAAVHPDVVQPIDGGDEHDEATALGRLGDFGKPEALQPGAQPTFGCCSRKPHRARAAPPLALAKRLARHRRAGILDQTMERGGRQCLRRTERSALPPTSPTTGEPSRATSALPRPRCSCNNERCAAGLAQQHHL